MESEKPVNSSEEPSVTMVDILQEEHELEEEYNAVLGASDEKCCTYPEGAIKRQALYSCLTCCPEARSDLKKCAGICLACSYRCHENHELVELYTKRNFRCDCPTERFNAEHRCLLNSGLAKLQERNCENLYNQNFQGLYCKCHRPYPDPDRTTEEVMLQCTVCEDWFHLHHLDTPTKLADVDACGEMICGDCMQQYVFLQDYTGLAIKTLDEADASLTNTAVNGDESLCEDNDNKLRSDLDKSISDIMNMAEPAKRAEDGKATIRHRYEVDVTEEGSEDADICHPEVKRRKLETGYQSIEPVEDKQKNNEDQADEPCRRPKGNNDYEKGATFWGNDWRAALCQCTRCLALYKAHKVEYLLDAEDSAKSYEERGKKRGAAESTYEQGIRALASIGRVQQIDAITEYNRMKDKLKEYLQKFAVAKKVVTEADINRFFEEMRNEKNAVLGQPYLCR